MLFTYIKKAKNIIATICILFTPFAWGYGGEFVAQWNQQYLEAVRINKPSPPVVARMLAFGHTCIYDAWSAYDEVALGLHFNKTGEKRVPIEARNGRNKRTSISFAAYYCALDLFPKQAELFNAHMKNLGYDLRDKKYQKSKAAEIGRASALASISYYSTDGSNQKGSLPCSPKSAVIEYCDYTGYLPKNPGTTPIENVDLNAWQPLPSGARHQTPLTPHWGKVKLFSVANIDEYLNAYPLPSDRLPKKSSDAAAYARQVQESLDESVRLGQDKSGEKKAIVLFWADGPFSYLPPGHWSKQAQWIVARDQLSLAKAVKLFFAMQHAANDTGIVVWHLKYKYDYVRPITSVRHIMNNKKIYAWGGPDTEWDDTINKNTGQAFGYNRYLKGEDWIPYNPTNNPNHPLTPAFPEYPSGHSSFSAASAKVMAYATKGIKFSHTEEYVANSPAWLPTAVEKANLVGNHRWHYPTFKSAANQAALSRRIGGIHFEDGDLVGRKIGEDFAELAWSKAQTLFAGKNRKLMSCHIGSRCHSEINTAWKGDEGFWLTLK